jgi:hypothetical protein
MESGYREPNKTFHSVTDLLDTVRMPGQVPTPQPMTGMSTPSRILEKLTVPQLVEMFPALYGI